MIFNFKIVLRVAIIITYFTISTYSMTGKIEMEPMKPKKLLIQNHEYLKYVKYAGNEIDYVLLQVYDINYKENIVTIYQQRFSEGSAIPIPRYFTNFTDYKKVSLSDYNLIAYHSDELSNFILENKKGIVQSDLQIDKTKQIASYWETVWDGNALRTRHSIIKIKTNFPVWDMGSLIFLGARFFDLKTPGIVYAIIPNILKMPVEIGFKYIGKEIIETKAGKFNTRKVGFYGADPFLAKLMESYSKEGFFWIDESEKGLIIKLQAPGSIYLLENISVWNGTEM